MGASCCSPSRAWARLADTRLFAALSDPARRSAILLKIALVMLHLLFAGVIFVFDNDLIEKTKREPWYTTSFAFLFVATLVQYFVTAGTSPGYVLDAQNAVNEKDALARRKILAAKQSASSENGSIITIDASIHSSGNATAWTKMVMDLYPPESSIRSFTCTYCNLMQPPRARHCHDCDKCVLQFDHHCVWLGACVGQGNHCLFWWYICEETVLCIWTTVIYIQFLAYNASKTWWEAIITGALLICLSLTLIFLLLLLIFHSYLVLTNQTTYELVRRPRIGYLRSVPGRVYPFSQGICRNLYLLCFASQTGGLYRLEPLPTAAELEKKSRPFTCIDLLPCRCC